MAFKNYVVAFLLCEGNQQCIHVYKNDSIVEKKKHYAGFFICFFLSFRLCVSVFFSNPDRSNQIFI